MLFHFNANKKTTIFKFLPFVFTKIFLKIKKCYSHAKNKKNKRSKHAPNRHLERMTFFARNLSLFGKFLERLIYFQKKTQDFWEEWTIMEKKFTHEHE